MRAMTPAAMLSTPNSIHSHHERAAGSSSSSIGEREVVAADMEISPGWVGSGRRGGGLGLREELLEWGLYAAGQDDHGAPGLARDVPGDAAEHHRAERAVAARAAD